MIKLSIYRDDLFQQTVEIAGSVARIGRAIENDIVLKDPDKGVSRFHAELHVEAGHIIVVDLNSQNGVWVGEQKVPRGGVLPGVSIGIGPYRLVLESEGLGAAVMAQPPAPSEVLSPEQASMAQAQQGTTLPSTVQPPRPKPAVPVRRRPIPMPALIAGGVLVLALAAALFATLPRRGSNTSSNQIPAAKHQPKDIPLPLSEDDRKFNDYMKEAQARVDEGNLDLASAALEEALISRPDNADALKLKDDIETKRLSQASVQTPPVVRPVPAQTDPFKDWPQELGRPTKNPGETTPAFLSRLNAIRTNHSNGQAAFDQGNYELALEYFKKVTSDGTTDTRLNETQQKLTDHANTEKLRQVKEALDRGRAYEAQGEWGKALDEYQNVDAKTEVARLQKSIDGKVQALTKTANNAKFNNDFVTARDAYQQILKTLSSKDPLWAEYQKELEKLRGKTI